MTSTTANRRRTDPGVWLHKTATSRAGRGDGLGGRYSNSMHPDAWPEAGRLSRRAAAHGPSSELALAASALAV
jgi:hypothetical protein